MNKIKLAAISLIAIIGFASFVPSYGVLAAPADEIGNGVQQAGGDDAGGDLPGFIQTVVNILLFLLGAVAVVMIVIGGIKYTTSNGDSSSVTSAKNTILYAVVGLVVAIMAYAIVNFVIRAF
jgi:hypothetical protein